MKGMDAAADERFETPTVRELDIEHAARDGAHALGLSN
jgi:hypothetical protein